VPYPSKRTLTKRISSRVRVNAILPGLMKTLIGGEERLSLRELAGGDVAEMCRRVPMGFGGDAWEAAFWGIPALNFDAMRQAYLRGAGAKYNDIRACSHIRRQWFL
jgi:hypothetical protein